MIATPRWALITALLLMCSTEAHAASSEANFLLAQLQAEGDEASSPADASLAAAAMQLLNEAAPVGHRIEATRALANLGDARALVFLGAASREQLPTLQIAALEAAAAYPSPEAVNLGRWRLVEVNQPAQVRQAAINLLVQLARPDAGEALLAIAEQSSLPRDIRADALDAVKLAYPELLEGRETPQVARTFVGNAIFSAANGVVGGVALSSVGEWGKLDAGVAIGAAGGAAIGTGVGALYTRQRPLTLGQGMLYGSAVGWGLDIGMRASVATSASANQAAALRVGGVAAGLGLGFWGMSRDPDPMAVMETNVAGWLGAELLGGINELTRGHLASRDIEYRYETTSAAVIGGAVLGLGTGYLLQDRWQLDLPQSLYGGVMAAELGWVGIWLPELVDNRWLNGTTRIGVHGGAALGLTAAHFMDANYKHGTYAGYGAVLGNALGAGIPMLAGATEDAPILGTMTGLGLAGTLAGTVLGPHMDPSPGDRAMVGVGIPLAALEGLALGYVLHSKDVFKDLQYPGLFLTSGATFGLGLSALGRVVEPNPGDMLLLGTTAAWGAWYGAMTPLALDLEGEPEDLVLSTVLTGDAFLIAGGLMISPLIDLDPRRTLIPQLGGVTGATLAALGMSLFTTEGPLIAQGAVIGSTAGILGGSVLEYALGKRRAKRNTQRLSLQRPAALENLGGGLTYTPSFAPWTDEDGQPGFYVGLEVAGF